MPMLDEPLKKTMDIIDVSKGGIPDYVKSVPTLVTSSKTIYSGERVFEWISQQQSREIEGLSSDYGCLLEADSGPIAGSSFCFITENGFVPPEECNRTRQNKKLEKPKGDSRLERLIEERSMIG
jgi:hypothetical protein